MASEDLLGDDQITMNNVDLKGWMSKKFLSVDLCDVDVPFLLVDADLDGVDVANFVSQHFLMPMLMPYTILRIPFLMLIPIKMLMPT